MRLFIVGSDRVDAIENFYVKYLRALDVELNFFPAHTIFHDYYYKSSFNKLLFRSGISGIYPRINKQFNSVLNSYKPDVMWVFKGMEIFPNSLEAARQKGIKLSTYNPDNPFIFTGRGSGNDNVKKSIGLYDLHFTYNLDIKKKLEDEYHAHTSLLPFGFDVSESLYEECAAQQEIRKLCFLGNPDRQRADFIMALAENGIELDVYGNNWSSFVQHANVTIFNPVYQNDFWKVLRRYRVQLNLMRVHNEDSHNMRSFEIPGVGGIMLAPDTTEHRMFFDDGKEAYFFNDVASCAEKVKMILSLSKEESARIRENARTRSISSGYDYKSRSAQVADQLTNLCRS